MNPPGKPSNNMHRSVRLRRSRRDRWRREGERSLAENLAMAGTVGWHIVAPTLLGIFIGRWLDRTFESGIFWSAGLLVAGLAIGCYLAWKRIMHE